VTVEFSITIGKTEKKVLLEKKDGDYTVTVGDRTYVARDVAMSGGVLNFFVGHRTYRALVSKNSLGTQITLGGRDYFVAGEEEETGAAGGAHHHGDGSVEAPMPGGVVAVNVKIGDTVAPGDPLVVLESMKMQNEITAPLAGKVTAVNCAAGDQVAFGAVLVEIEAR
jgi:acetyl/propionyl-CoA carboxylase alpha subunit